MSRKSSIWRSSVSYGSTTTVVALGRTAIRVLSIGLLILWAAPANADLIVRLGGLLKVNSEVSVNPSSSADWHNAADPSQSSAFSVDLGWDDTLSGLSVEGKDDTYYVPLLSDPFFQLEDPDLSGNAVREGSGLDMKIKYKSSYNRTEIEVKFDSGAIFNNLSDTVYTAAHDIELNTGKQFKITLTADGQYFTAGEAPTLAQFTSFMSNLNPDDSDRELKLKWDDGGGQGAPKDPEVVGRITSLQVVPEPSSFLLFGLMVQILLGARHRRGS